MIRLTKRIFILATFVFVFSPFHATAESDPKVIHVFVALCDNEFQGIAPVPAMLGDGDDPRNNLYWGAMYGVKTYFKKSPNWELISTNKISTSILERCVFKHTTENVILLADAYRGREIERAIIDFFYAASGTSAGSVSVKGEPKEISAYGKSNLSVYIGHDGLMEFRIRPYPKKQNDETREAIILACQSKTYFHEGIKASGAKPLIWTTGNMAPEAYTLENAIEGWIQQETDESIQLRAAKAYDKYQKCGVNGAKRLLATGF